MTITFPAVEIRLALTFVFAVYAGVGIGLLWRHRIPGLSLTQSIRAAFYLIRYRWALGYYGLRRAEYKSHVEALRADLGAVDPNDIDTALRGLGPPRTLAAEVTTEVTSGALRPTTIRGAIWFWVAVWCTLAVSVLVSDAFLAGFKAAAEQGDQASLSVWGFDIEATMRGNGRVDLVDNGAIEMRLLLPLVAFVLGARPWRLLSRSKPGSETPPGP